MTNKAQRKIAKVVAKAIWKETLFNLWDGFADNLPVNATQSEKEVLLRATFIELQKLITTYLNKGGK